MLGLVGAAEDGVEFAEREAEPALSEQVAPVPVGALERDRCAVRPLLDADEDPGVFGPGGRHLQPQCHRAAELSVLLEVVIEDGRVAPKVEPDASRAARLLGQDALSVPRGWIPLVNDLNAAQLMPSVPELLDRARALSLVDGIHEPDDWDYGGYRLERRAGHESCLMLRAQNLEARFVDVHFSDAGCLVLGFELEGQAALLDEELRLALAEHLPAALKGCYRSSTAPSWMSENDMYAGLTFAIWRTTADERWHQVIFSEDMDEDVDPYAAAREVEVMELLADLISPRPEALALGASAVHGADLADGTWSPTELTHSEAVRHVIALRPLTEQVVQTLSPHVTLEDAKALANRLEYPLDGSRAQGPVREAGAPVIATKELPGLWTAYALEASEGAGQRIFARHSGTVWEVAGEGTESHVIHAESRPCDSQRFIIQHVDAGGAYRETDSMQRDKQYRILAADSRLAVEVLVDGGPLFLAPPHDGASQRFTAGYEYFGDTEASPRHYHCLHSAAGFIGCHPILR
ncbi:hypothetical protein QZN11_19805 [Streptomyces gramineus]